MQAIVYTEYGSPDVLELKEVEKPVPKDDEVLIKMRAVSLNASDWEMLTGTPLYSRIRGLLKPKYTILGSDIAGQVKGVGHNVKQFQPGDDVFGDIIECMGGFAEYVCVPERLLMLKPSSMTFEEAAALPQSACIALQGIRDKGNVQSGQTVLINGAGGGAGTFAVQLAKLFGAVVTGVDNSRKLKTMRSVGADHVVDYTREDFTTKKKRYDMILDLSAYHSIFDYKRALGPKGIYTLVGGSVVLIIKLLFLGPWISMIWGKKMGILAMKPNKDLSTIVDFIKANKLYTVIDKQYSLSEVPKALRYLGEGKARGKIVITYGKGSRLEPV